MNTDVQQALRLARMDLGVIARNRTALANAVLMPLVLAVVLVSAANGAEGEHGNAPVLFVLTGQMAAVVVFATFVNLAGFYTARREELVLKRLLGGPASAFAILGGSAFGATLIYLLQVVLLCVAAVTLGGNLPANPALLLLAAVLGAALFSLLAMVISGLSSSGEVAQLATVPVMLLCFGASPVMMPLDVLPEQVRTAAEFLPMTPIVELIRTGFLGTDNVGTGAQALGFVAQWTTALPSLGILAAWLLVAALLAKRYFRWDPRRG